MGIVVGSSTAVRLQFTSLANEEMKHVQYVV
jgi:rubrerythrin